MDQASADQLHAQMLQMQGALQLLMAQQAAAQPPGGVAGPSRTALRLPPPASFDGRASALDGWLADMKKQFDHHAVTQDGERLRQAPGFLTGAAYDWWERLDVASRPTTWEAFAAALRKRFQPVTSADTARAKLLALAQGKTTVNEYIASFLRLLMAVPSMSEDDRLFQFLRGLRPQIAVQLRMQGVSTVDEAINKAARVGSAGELSGLSSFGASTSAHAAAPMELDAIEELKDDETSSGSSSSRVARLEENVQEMLAFMREQRKGNGSASSGPPSSRGSFAPRGGRSASSHRNRGLPQIPHLSPLQVKEYMDAGRCFGCGSTEHQSRQCPKRKEGAGQAN
jgi:hypothetical protein